MWQKIDACLLRAALKTSAVLLLVISFAGSPQAQAQVSSAFDPNAAPAAAVQAHLPACVGGEHVLLIEDINPWGGTANVTELNAQNKLWCGIHSNQLAATNLALFGEVLLASSQTPGYYTTLFPGGVVDPAITAFVFNGGILSASLTGCGHGGGDWVVGGNCFGGPSATMVGGLTHVTNFTNDNNILNGAHPLVSDALPCPSGNCAVQVDAGFQADLDNWNFSDHGFFTTLPPLTTVILTSAGGPVAIEYPWGAGRVIALLTTTEWRYDVFGANKKMLANDIAYQDDIAVKKVAIDIKFCSNPNGYQCKANGVVPVTIFGSAGVAVADINIASLRLCLALTPALCTGPPKSSSVADRGNPALDQGAAQCAVIDGVQQNYRNPDGYPDLDVGFNNQGPGVSQLVGCPPGPNGAKKTASPTLILKGFMNDGTPLISSPIVNSPGVDQLWFQ